jgi:hypothetical protein
MPRTPGDYALLHANGMSWADLVEWIRAEAVAGEHCGEGCTGHGCTICERWDAPDARPGTTDHTLLRTGDDA